MHSEDVRDREETAFACVVEPDHDVVTVIIPEFVLQHWWSGFLHNQSALLLKARLLMRKGTVVTSVPTHID